MSDPFDAPAKRGATYIDEDGIERDTRWNRPIVDGKPRTRATTMARTLADEYNIHAWKMRKLAKGLTIGADDLLSLASVTDEDARGAAKVFESEIIEPALDRAGANAGRKKGTALHKATHRFDAGAALDTFPDWTKKSLSMYRHQMWSNAIGMQNNWIEVFTACDEVGAAGTTDRILSHQSWGEKFRVGDLKTQKDHPREFNALEIAVQLAIYAHGLDIRGIWRVDDMSTGAGHWDTSTVGRMDLEHAVVMWLPVAGEHAGKCELVDIDIAWGWTIARMSERVRAERKVARSKATTLRFDTPAALPGAATPMTQDDKIDAAFSGPDTHSGISPSHGGLIDHKGRIEDCPAPDHESPHIDYAGKMCPDGRVHGAHDGCPGRKKRSPAQIKADEQAASPHAALAEMSQPVSGPGIEAALAAGEARRQSALDQATGGAVERLMAEDSMGGPVWPSAEEINALPFIDHTDPETDQDEPVKVGAPNAKTPEQLAGEAEQVFAELRSIRKETNFLTTAAGLVDPVIALRAKIKALKTKEEMSLLWQEHQPIWTDDLTRLGLATLSGANA